MSLRALAGLLDLSAVLLLGALVSLIALYSSSSVSTAPSFVTGLLGQDENIPTRSTIIFVAFFTIFLFLLKALLAAWLTYRSSVFLATCEAQASAKIADTLSSRKLGGLEMLGSTELIYAMKQGTHAAFGGLLQNFATLIAETFLFTCIAIVFFIVNPMTTIFILVVMVTIGIGMHFYLGKRIQSNSQQATSDSQSIDNAINNLVGGFREIYSAGVTEKFLRRVSIPREKFARLEANQTFLHSLPRYVIETAVILMILAIGLVQLVDVNISQTASTLGVFLAGGMRIVAAMVPLQAALGQLRHFVPEAKQALLLVEKLGLQDLEIHPKKNQEASRRQLRHSKPVELSFFEATFSYPGTHNFAVNSLTLEVPPGNHVALIGKSGAGKSTIADLALGLLEPSEGTVAISGMSPERFIKKHPGSVGYVPQKPTKFPGNFIENIALGVPKHEVNKARIMEVLAQANLLDFVLTQKETIETDLTKTRLSGGQLQRLGLARALYQNPRLLILDEISASLDAESERAISASLEMIRGQVSVLIIAHRISTIKKADMIFVLEGGQIVEKGNFSQLCKQGKSFSKYLSKVD